MPRPVNHLADRELTQHGPDGWQVVRRVRGKLAHRSRMINGGSTESQCRRVDPVGLGSRSRFGVRRRSAHAQATSTCGMQSTLLDHYYSVSNADTPIETS